MEKLSTEEKLLLFLLRNDSDNCTNILSHNEIDSPSFLSLAENHYVAGVICFALLDKYKKYLNTSQIAYCKMRIIQIIEENRIKKELLANASQILHKAGIPVLVLKGPALDYSKNQLRLYNDLDILIPKDNLLKAVKILESKGYEYRGSDILTPKEKSDIPGQLEWNNQFQFRVPGMLQEIEIHTNLFERKRVRFENLDSLLNHVELFSERKEWKEEFSSYYPCPEASLALLCLHTALKRSPANNTYVLRQAIDIEALIAQKIDWVYFLYLCQEWRICYYAYFTLKLQETITSNACPILEALAGNMKKTEIKLTYIHLNCLNNFKRNSLFHMFRYRIFMPFAIGGGFWKSIMWYFRVCFPQKVIQAKRYGISEKSFWIWGSYLANPLRSLWIIIHKV